MEKINLEDTQFQFLSLILHFKSSIYLLISSLFNNIFSYCASEAVGKAIGQATAVSGVLTSRHVSPFLPDHDRWMRPSHSVDKVVRHRINKKNKTHTHTHQLISFRRRRLPVTLRRRIDTSQYNIWLILRALSDNFMLSTRSKLGWNTPSGVQIRVLLLEVCLHQE